MANLKMTPATDEEIVAIATELGIPKEAMTWDVIKQVRKGLKLSFKDGPEQIKDAILWAFKSGADGE
jgi:hypothetical protein